MAAQKVAEFLLERLRAWDVDTVFGYPGDGINGIVTALGKGEGPRFVQARHEEMAAFEAVGYAKFTGRVGVCMATSGPGAIHLLNGLYDAKLDHVPVVAIVGQAARTSIGGSFQQEVDLPTLFKDVASDYVQLVTVPEQLPNVIDRAIRIAHARRAPTAVIIPADVQELDYSAPTHAMKMVPSSLGVSWPEVQPDMEGIRKAADVLNEARAMRRPRSRRWPSCSVRASRRPCSARTRSLTPSPTSRARSVSSEHGRASSSCAIATRSSPSARASRTRTSSRSRERRVACKSTSTPP
jgi:pyruvate dehydrogenase (quinone)